MEKLRVLIVLQIVMKISHLTPIPASTWVVITSVYV